MDIKNRIKEYVPPFEQNLSAPERIFSLISGAALLYYSIKEEKKKTGLAAGYLVLRGATGYCSLYQAFGKSSKVETHNINAKTVITVNKPIEEVYSFWRKLDNLPLFMKHLKKVEVLDDKISEWEAKIPKGLGTIKWKSEIVEDQPNERLGWHSLPGSDIENAGNVHFRDAGRFGTEVHVVISYRAPAGKVGEKLAELLNPALEEIVKEDIRGFRRYLESGELPTIEGQPKGK